MLEIFQYGFMLRAFAAGIIVAVISPLIGTFLVTRKYSLISDTLSHVSLAGVMLGLLIGINPIFTALGVALLAAWLIERIRGEKKVSGETVLSLFLSGGLAIAVILMGLGKGFGVDLFSYLFGSITTVRNEDLFIILILGTVVLVTILMMYKKLLYVCYDEEGARVAGLPVKSINFLLITLAAFTVVVAMRIVGVLLIGALMTIPAITAMQVAKSFKQSLVLSVFLSLAAVTGGLWLAFYFNLAAGGAIVILALTFFGISRICD